MGAMWPGQMQRCADQKVFPREAQDWVLAPEWQHHHQTLLALLTYPSKKTSYSSKNNKSSKRSKNFESSKTARAARAFRKSKNTKSIYNSKTGKSSKNSKSSKIAGTTRAFKPARSARAAISAGSAIRPRKCNRTKPLVARMAYFLPVRIVGA